MSQAVIDMLQSNLSHRLEKLWRIFTWSSSLLIGITSGIIVLSKTHSLTFSLVEQFLITAIILILTLYSYFWIKENLMVERNIRNQLDQLFEEEFQYPLVKAIRPDRQKLGYKSVILLLGMVALVAVWIL